MALPVAIEAELELARIAAEDGNEGKARVCARRAVGKAFSLSPLGKREVNSSLSTIQCLGIISKEDGISEEARISALRLMKSVTENRGASASRTPVEDALLIINALLAA